MTHRGYLMIKQEANSEFVGAKVPIICGFERHGCSRALPKNVL